MSIYWKDCVKGMQPSYIGKDLRGEGIRFCSFSFVSCWFDIFVVRFCLTHLVHIGSFGLDFTVAYSKPNYAEGGNNV